MRYYLDFEFNEEKDPVEPISIGIVADDNREFYGIFPFDREACNDWVKLHVLPVLTPPQVDMSHVFMGPKEFIRDGIEKFIGEDPSPIFWGYFADYDWYLFCRLWGSFAKLPPRFPCICFDIKQELYRTKQNKLPSFEPDHNALIDARWTKAMHQALVKW